MDQRLTIITLGVRSVIISTLFYESVLGWKRSEDSNDNITFFKCNGILLSIYQKDALAEDAGVNADGVGFSNFTLSYNTRNKEAVDSTFKELEEKNVTIVKPPEEAFWGGYSGYFADPDGFLWEVAYNPFLEMDSDGRVRS